LSKDCGTILQEYKAHVNHQKEATEQLVRYLVVSLTLSNFVGLAYERAEERTRGFNREAMVSKSLMKCAKKFLNMSR
jgi:hypothetical protein